MTAILPSAQYFFKHTRSNLGAPTGDISAVGTNLSKETEYRGALRQEVAIINNFIQEACSILLEDINSLIRGEVTVKNINNKKILGKDYEIKLEYDKGSKLLELHLFNNQENKKIYTSINVDDSSSSREPSFSIMDFEILTDDKLEIRYLQNLGGIYSITEESTDGLNCTDRSKRFTVVPGLGLSNTEGDDIEIDNKGVRNLFEALYGKSPENEDLDETPFSSLKFSGFVPASFEEPGWIYANDFKGNQGLLMAKAYLATNTPN